MPDVPARDRDDESRTAYRARAMRWRLAAADPTPDTWFWPDNEYADWVKWARSIGAPGAGPSPAQRKTS